MQLETLNESLEEPTFPKEYRNLANVFSLSNANSLSPDREKNHAIELNHGKTPLFGPLCNLSEYQLKTLRKYIDKNLANKFIWLLQSSVGTSVLFTPKHDANLRFCFDYRRLNSMTIINWYPFPLIDEIIDRLSMLEFLPKLMWRMPTIAFKSEKMMRRRPFFKHNTDY